MQSDKKLYSRKDTPPPAYEVGGYTYGISGTSTLNATFAGPKHPGPLDGVELQASEMCPKNFIIFDQSDNISRILFHPVLANKFNYPTFDIHATCAKENGAINCNSKESSSLKEDTRDIDALLSSEDDDNDEDEEVSTGRTMGNHGTTSPDSHSTSSSRPSKMRSSIQKSSCHCSSSSSSSEKKRRRMKKMLTALRGIVPGGDHMDTVTVLDEAVRYLKSLKVEVKKLGSGNFKKN